MTRCRGCQSSSSSVLKAESGITRRSPRAAKRSSRSLSPVSEDSFHALLSVAEKEFFYSSSSGSGQSGSDLDE